MICRSNTGSRCGASILGARRTGWRCRTGRERHCLRRRLRRPFIFQSLPSENCMASRRETSGKLRPTDKVDRRRVSQPFVNFGGSHFLRARPAALQASHRAREPTLQPKCRYMREFPQFAFGHGDVACAQVLCRGRRYCVRMSGACWCCNLRDVGRHRCEGIGIRGSPLLQGSARPDLRADPGLRRI
jgi:hypothetical protein